MKKNTSKKTKSAGRPTIYTIELAERICEELENSPRGIDYVCEQHEDFPTSRTVRGWLKKVPGFFPMYAHAKQLQADKIADEMVEIAFYDKKDWKIIYDSEGKEKKAFVPEAVNRSRLKVDTLKWRAEILAPHKYNLKNLEKEKLDGLSNAIDAMKELANKCLQQIK